MQLVATQNFINLINGWKKTNTTATPTSFSNAPDVDNGMNLITMGTGTGGSEYQALNVVGGDTAQKIVQLSTGGKLNADNGSTIPVWDRDLQVTNYNIGTAYNFLSVKDIWLSPRQSRNPFSNSSGTDIPYSIAVALTDDETPVTVETTNCQGNIYYGINAYASRALNNKVYIPFDYRYSDANRAPSFTAKKILITTARHDMATYPPIILAGGLLDNPIEVSYGANLMFELTHDLTVAFS